LQLCNVPEVKATRPSTFNDLTNVIFKSTNAQVANRVTVLYTDNFFYTTSGVCCK
jgi:hypothetical protein